MKSETEVRKELDLLHADLQEWQRKYDRVDMRQEGAAARRLIVANTVVGIEGRIEALQWVLEEE